MFLAAIVYLAPSVFPDLPKNLILDLQRRGCKVPQVEVVEGIHNVIKGEFAKPGQTDWAVLCSVNGLSSVIVYWNASAADPAIIEAQKDENRLQGWGPDKTIYDRQLAPVGERTITEYYKGFGGQKPPPMNHQGIDDMIIGKASVVLYYYKGKWLHLQGAD